MQNPRASDSDLTAKARIRNAAMDLFAEHGEARVSLRQIAAKAGVTLGLVQHHFKTKAGLVEAVDQLVVDYFAQTIAAVPQSASPREYALARDEAVRKMLHENPPVQNYMRRSLLDPTDQSVHLLEVFIELTRNEVTMLREAGLASVSRSPAVQILQVVIRQVGEMMLQPLVDGVWERVGSSEATKPQLAIEIRNRG